MATPSWVTPAGNRGTYQEQSAINTKFLARPQANTDTVQYTANSGLPAGTTLYPNGLWTGNLASSVTPGKYKFQVTATEYDAFTPVGNAVSNFFIDVVVAPPVWQTTSNMNGTTFIEGSNPNFTFVASTIHSNTTLSYSLISGNLPASELNNILYVNANTGLLSGILANVNKVETSNFVLRASEFNTSNVVIGFADRTFSMVVQGPDAPAWITPSGNLPNAQPNIYYNYQILYDNPDPNTTAQFRITHGSLPDGIEYAANGLIAGYANYTQSTGNGNITAVFGSTTVTGRDTTFLADFNDYYPNTILYSSNGTVIGTVANVTSNSVLTLQSVATTDVVAEAYKYTRPTSVVTAELFSESGVSDSANFTLNVDVPDAPFLPVIWNNEAPSFDPNNLAPYVPYYITGDNLGTYRSDTYFAFKMIGHSYNTGEVLSYSAANLPSGLAIDANTGWIYGNVPAAAGGIQTFSNMVVTVGGSDAANGTITSSTGSNVVTGFNTDFVNQLAPGYVIKNKLGSNIGLVNTIANSTSLTLTTNALVTYPTANKGTISANNQSNLATGTNFSGNVSIGDAISAPSMVLSTFIVANNVTSGNATIPLVSSNSTANISNDFPIGTQFTITFDANTLYSVTGVTPDSPANSGNITVNTAVSSNVLLNSSTFTRKQTVLGLVANVNSSNVTFTSNAAANTYFDTANVTTNYRVERAAFTTVSPGVSKSFQMTVIDQSDVQVTWVTPSDLGTIRNGDTSTLQLVATSTQSALVYQMAYGRLPPGLQLNMTNGEIYGRVLFDDTVQVGSTVSYVFEVRAYSTTNIAVTSVKQFTLNVYKAFEQAWESVYFEAYPSVSDRQKIDSMLTGVYSLEITVPGENYITTPTIVIADPDQVGGKTATATATIAANGSFGNSISSVTLTNSGYGYSSAPTVTVGREWLVYDVVAVNDQVFYGNNLYTTTVGGQFDTTPPTNTSGSPFTSGSATLRYVGNAGKMTATLTVPSESIYRPTDPNWGLAKSVSYENFVGANSSSYQEYLDVINSYQANTAIGTNHYWRNLTLGELQTAVARNSNNEIIYEVVYSLVIDDLVNNKGTSVSKQQPWPRAIATPYSPKSTNYVYPNSLYNMKAQEQQVGYVDSISILPAWMTSQQLDGTTKDYVQAWVIAYCKPGTSTVVKNRIQNWLTTNNYSLNQIDFSIDRFNVNKSITAQNYTGTISSVSGSNTVVGTGTSFTTEIIPGDVIVVNSLTLGIVSLVVDDVTLKLQRGAYFTFVDQDYGPPLVSGTNANDYDVLFYYDNSGNTDSGIAGLGNLTATTTSRIVTGSGNSFVSFNDQLAVGAELRVGNSNVVIGTVNQIYVSNVNSGNTYSNTIILDNFARANVSNGSWNYVVSQQQKTIIPGRNQ